MACETNQLNDPTTTLDGYNCNTASDSMLICRATNGHVHPTAGQVRSYCLNPDGTHDVSGGTNLRQVHDVNRNHYGVASIMVTPIDWDKLPALAKNHGFVLAMSYSVLKGSHYDCFRGQFALNHSIWVDSLNSDGTWRARDPGADGRPGVPKGYMNYPDSVLRLGAGRLDFGGETLAEKYGSGKAYVLLSPADPVVQTDVPHVVSNAPKPSERNVMIPQGGLVVSSDHVMSLAAGQPLFRSPGGPQVTKMSAAAKVHYMGSAGTGWRAVRVSTGAPYGDHVTRPTILYVPAAAGTISQR